MILYWILSLFQTLKFSLVSIIPTIETPVWLAAHLPDILLKIVAFNYYLPVFDAFTVALFCIGITFTWKFIKIGLSVFIDMNA